MFIDEGLTYKEMSERLGISAEGIEGINNRHFHIKRTKEEMGQAIKKQLVRQYRR